MNQGRFTGMRVAVYARFSSALQSESSIDDQVYRCRQFIEHVGGAVNDSLIFSDAAMSGASLHRPQFERMVALVEQKAIDAIVVEDVSRLSRDFADAAALFRQFQYLGVPIIGIADGVDTGEKHGKLTFTIKSLVCDIYLDDLRDKTLRGLEGRARAGKSTGGLPYGYRSTPIIDEFGREQGRHIELHPDQAPVMRRIFDMYLSGLSLAAIAGTLNDEDVLPPRAHTRHRRKGWTMTTIRAMLSNAAYIGDWSFKKKQWRKLPGTNVRRYRERPDDEVIRNHYEDRRIIDPAQWTEVQLRLATVAQKYRHGSKISGQRGRRNKYLLSGFLVCAECGAPMVVTAGTSARYYTCGDAKNRRTCPNRLSVREDLAREAILAELEQRFLSPPAIAFLRKAIVDYVRQLGQVGSDELRERQSRLARTKVRIDRLVEFLADGNASPSVAATLKDLEAQAAHEQNAINALKASAAEPVVLPTPDEVLRLGLRLKDILRGDPMEGASALRTLLRNGTIKMRPQKDRTYIAEGEYWPLLAIQELSATKPRNPETGTGSGLSGRLLSCAGAIRRVYHGPAMGFTRRVA